MARVDVNDKHAYHGKERAVLVIPYGLPVPPIPEGWREHSSWRDGMGTITITLALVASNGGRS